MSSGSGFLGGYGRPRRSNYATPAELGFTPWAADFLLSGGLPGYPVDARFNPYTGGRLEWQTEDWDPGLRFWTLPFDPNLTEWLQDTNLAAPSTLAAREFAGAHATWQADEATLLARRWLRNEDVVWSDRFGTNTGNANAAWGAINLELQELVDLMQDSRAPYLAETRAQADGIPSYFRHLLAMDSASRPATAMLIRACVAVGNVAYPWFKDRFRRVRPSTLCPGLVPPFGPPRHPAFPSGHAFLGHFIALALLQIPGVRRRYGENMTQLGTAGQLPAAAWFRNNVRYAPTGPLMWLADRLARNRERIGVHYRSDSTAGARLAGAIAQAIWQPAAAPNGDVVTINVPTMHRLLRLAEAEWP